MSKPICFIIQQFGTAFYEELYDDVIEIAVKQANAICTRADKILGAKPPLEKIREKIENEASICIAEVTENNPNVFMEVGWAYAKKRPIFLLWDKANHNRSHGLPFDIQHHPGIPYDSSKSGWRKELRERLVENIIAALTEVPQINISSRLSVSELMETFLAYRGKQSTSAASYQWYIGHIKSFLNYIGKNADEPAITLKSIQVEQWVHNQKDWGPNNTRGAITALQSAYNWAVRRGHIPENPIRNIEKPKAIKRNNPMSLKDYERILAQINEHDNFRDILIVVWNTDCRPEEIRHLEAKYINLEKKCIRIPQGVGRAGQKPRIIHFNEEAAKVLERLIIKRPEGKLFLNTRGKVWSKYALCNRIYRCSKAIGKSYALSDCRNGGLSGAIAA